MINRRQLPVLGLAAAAAWPVAGAALAKPGRAPVRISHTYLHAYENKRTALGKFLELNWLGMYREAIAAGHMSHAVLYETGPEEINESGYKIDYVVETGFYTAGGFNDVSAKIEAIAFARKTVLVDGEDLRGLGKVKDERHLLLKIKV